MTEHKNGVARCAPLGRVLHIGAGAGQDVPAYLAAGACQITLVEPEAEFQPALAALAQEQAAVHVVMGAAVATLPEGEATALLRRFSFAGLNSLLPPKAGLQALFPGLQPVEPVLVAVHDVVALARDMDLDQAGAHVLVLEAPGQALDLLTALQAADLLEKFRLIRVQEGRLPLYEGATAISEIESYLAEVGFGTAVVLGGKDPDWPVLEVEADAELTQQVSMRVHRATLADLAAAERSNRMLSDRLAQAEAARGVAEIRTAQQNLGVALRMQFLRETDLKELQQRYADLLQHKESQDAVLHRLSEKMTLVPAVTGPVVKPAPKKPTRKKPATAPSKPAQTARRAKKDSKQ